MSKAEERTRQYRNYREEYGIKDPVVLDEIEEAYYQGYKQAIEDALVASRQLHIYTP